MNTLATWALYSAVGVSTATGVGVATGVIPSEPFERIVSSFTGETVTGEASEKEQKVASLPQSKAESPAKAIDGSSAAPKEKAEQSDSAAPQDKPAELIVEGPAFDILRVEPDGSVLAAGRARPDQTVEVITPDGKVLGTGKAGPGGDFVVLLDQQLKPGDYSLYLRGRDKEGKESISNEVATVRIPEKPDGEVLALVTKEGEASRVIAVPKPKQQEKVEVAEADPKPEPAAEPEKKEVPTKPSETAEKPADKEAVPTEKTEIAEGQNQTEQVAKETSPSETAKPEEEVAEAPKPTEAAPEPVVIVEAVEIENGHIFVAGAANKGATVRVYIDNKLVGDARGTADQRFLIQKKFDLSPGRHVVRADVIDRKTGKALARAEVPLLHEPVVQVAEARKETKPEPKPGETAKVTAPKRAETPKPTAEAQPTKQEKSAEVAKVQPKEAQDTKVAKAEPEPAPKSKPTQPVAGKEQPKATESAKPVETVQAESEKPVATEEQALAEDRGPVLESEGEENLIRTGSTIIIKPGDNLWRISRKTYGRGIRYTTIYNANRDQIRDPSRIYIGQIFKIPQNAEAETSVQ